MTTKAKREQEIVERAQDRLDNVYFQCVEIMRMPSKWAIDKNNNIIPVYPHPVVKREGYRVERIEYLPYKSFYLPDVLMQRHYYWQEQTSRNATPPTKEDAIKWSKMRQSGMTYSKIAEQAGVKPHTVSYYIKKYCKEAI
jgi:hypothetical protein